MSPNPKSPKDELESAVKLGILQKGALMIGPLPRRIKASGTEMVKDLLYKRLGPRLE